MRSRILISLALLVSVLALAGCGAGGGNTIKVAILAPLTGPVPTFGESTRDGAMLAINEWNEDGGVLGKQVEVILEDSQCSAEAAVSAANKVIDQDGVKFLIGEVCSSASIPVSEIVVEKGALQISPTSTNEMVTVAEDGSTKPTVFRACFIDDFQGLVGATFVMDSLGAQTAAVMYDQGNDYVRGLAESFMRHFEAAGGTILVQESYTDQDTDFSAILTKVKDADPDVLYLPDYYNKVNLIGAQAKEQGMAIPMMGGDGWDSSDADQSALDGGYYTNHFSPVDSRPVVQEFVANYEAEYGARPDALAALAYDAVYVLFQAMEDAGEADPMKVAAAMESGSFDVVSGEITYDEFHNPVKAALVLGIKDGTVNYVDSYAP